MGINCVGANLLQDKDSPFYQFSTIGLSITCSADNLITDSAAGATAIATGYLTKNKYISVDSLGNPLTTIFEVAEKLHLSTGIVVTASVSHATPGAFVAHSVSRYDQTTIALQMVQNDFDFVIGGGSKYFMPVNLSGERVDNLNLIDSLSSKRYFIAKNYPDLVSIPDSVKQLYALMAPDGLPDASQRDYSLSDLTKQAVKHLRQNQNGFILMIEGSQIDWGEHDHKSKMVIDELKDFTTAIQSALDFAREDQNTLVLVTSDHETGGMSIINGNQSADKIELGFTSNGHTPSPVGIFAYGPGESHFKGIMHINQIGQKLFGLLDPAKKF